MRRETLAVTMSSLSVASETPAIESESRGRFDDLLAGVPGTAAYRRQVKVAIADRVSNHLEWFERLPGEVLDSPTRGRIEGRVRDLLLGEAATHERRRAVFVSLTGLLTIPTILGAVFGAIAFNIDDGVATLAIVAMLFSIIFLINYSSDANHPVNAESEILYWLLLCLHREVQTERDWRAPTQNAPSCATSNASPTKSSARCPSSSDPATQPPTRGCARRRLALRRVFGAGRWRFSLHARNHTPG
jgi:hypothetical protein